MPKIVKMFENSKGKLKHNAGPLDPITKEEVKASGSLHQVYKNRSSYDPFAADVVGRIKKHPIPSPKAIIPKKKKPLLTRVGEQMVSDKTKRGLKVTTER